MRVTRIYSKQKKIACNDDHRKKIDNQEKKRKTKWTAGIVDFFILVAVGFKHPMCDHYIQFQAGYLNLVSILY